MKPKICLKKWRWEMASQKNCPECQGTMVLTAGVGGLFWRCQKCGKKIPLASGALDEQGDCSGK